MSRIEKALEKALNQRGQEPEQTPTPSQQNAGDLPAVPNEQTRRPDYSAFNEVPPPEIRNPVLITATQPDAPASEQYRKLKSILVKMVRSQKAGRSLLVTSSIGGEGKTVTSINLAITLAQEFDHTVLLVEADLRRPTLMNYLNMKAERGLTDCLLDGASIADVLVKTGIGKLSVLPAGRPVKNPVELFSSDRMHEVMAEIKDRYPDRFVIIDSTPILPFAEAHILATQVDSVLYVARQDYTPFEKLKEGIANLKSHNLLGVVCNDMDEAMIGSGYYGYYGYGAQG